MNPVQVQEEDKEEEEDLAEQTWRNTVTLVSGCFLRYVLECP